MLRVKGQKYLYRRGECLYFRRGVPQDVRSAFGGREEVVVSLGAGSPRSVQRAFAHELALFEKTLADARRASVASPRPVRIAEPSNREIEEAVREWFSDRLDRVCTDYVGPEGEQQRSDQFATLANQLDDVQRSAGVGGSDPTITTEWIAEALADREGWRIEKGSPTERRIFRVIIRGQIEAIHRQMQELGDSPRKVIDETFGPEQYRLDVERKRGRAAQEPISIMGLFQTYLDERQPAAATAKAWMRFFAAFVSFLKHDDATRLTGPDIVAWKDHLLKEVGSRGQPRSRRTVREGYLAAIKAVFNYAVENHRLPANPADKIGVRSPKSVRLRSKALSDQEADIILGAALRVSSSSASAHLPPDRLFARRWVPWLCAYTGARVNEMTQLRAEDVTNCDGIWAVLITPEAGSVKTGEARLVPLHPHLIEQGFPAAVAGKTGPLFYDPKRYKGGKDGNPLYKNTGEHLARWVRAELGVTDHAVAPNHGWRHRFKSQAREVRMSEEVRDHIQGHAPRTDGEAYGDFSPAVMLREIMQLPRYKV